MATDHQLEAILLTECQHQNRIVQGERVLCLDCREELGKRRRLDEQEEIARLTKENKILKDTIQKIDDLIFPARLGWEKLEELGERIIKDGN